MNDRMRYPLTPFGALLDAHLTKRGMKQQWLAGQVPIAPGSLNRAMKGVRNPSAELVLQISTVLELSSEEERALLYAAGYGHSAAVPVDIEAFNTPGEVPDATTADQKLDTILGHIEELTARIMKMEALIAGYTTDSPTPSGASSETELLELRNRLIETGPIPQPGAETSKIPVIVIDYPVSDDITNVGAILASMLGFRFLNSGNMYRAITWLALHLGIPMQNEEALESLAENSFIFVKGQYGEHLAIAGWEVGPDPEMPVTSIWSEPILRTPVVDEYLNMVSRLPKVKSVVAERLRNLAKDGKIVIVGQKLCTDVLPDARVKVALSRSSGLSIYDQQYQWEQHAKKIDSQQLLQEAQAVEAIDKTPEPNASGDDTVLIDTTGLRFMQIIARILTRANQQWPEVLGPALDAFANTSHLYRDDKGMPSILEAYDHEGKTIMLHKMDALPDSYGGLGLREDSRFPKHRFIARKVRLVRNA